MFEMDFFSELKIIVKGEDGKGNVAHIGRLSITSKTPDLIAWTFDQQTLTLFSKGVQGIAALSISSDTMKEKIVYISIKGKKKK